MACARLVALGRDSRAVTAVEYSLMAALIATALVAAILPLRRGLLRVYDGITVALTGDPSMR